jgi:putative membrane protein
MVRILKGVFWLGLTLVLLLFVLQNGSELVRPVEIKLDLFLKDLSPGSIPQYALVLGALLVGLLVGGVWGIFQQLRLRANLKETQRLLREREKELDSLRNLPVVETASLQSGSQPGPPVGTYSPGEASR